MGNINSIPNNLYNFENMQNAINNNYIIINTLSETNQHCLINGTISIDNEVNVINNYLKSDKNKPIIIYGKNSSDISVINKYKQLTNLGFKNVNIYQGGMFEWLLLQDVYGNEHFVTTSQEVDILKYK
tara:strand:- start:27 stop:410 length:384 start_codon:yes stop_codon:yes gene_type:complete